MKSKKYRIGVYAKKVYQTLPNGKTILRLQPVVGHKSLERCKWKSHGQIKADNEKAEKVENKSID